jgi:hypothetical protein
MEGFELRGARAVAAPRGQWGQPETEDLHPVAAVLADEQPAGAVDQRLKGIAHLPEGRTGRADGADDDAVGRELLHPIVTEVGDVERTLPVGADTHREVQLTQ